MALNQRADNIEPEVYLSYMEEEYPERNMFVKSGIFATPPATVAAQLNAGGTLINMPYWDYLPVTSGVIPTDNPADILTTQKVTADKDIARKLFRVEGYSGARLAGLLATGDGKAAEKHALRNMGTVWENIEQSMLISTMKGIFADNVANDSGDMVYSVYSDIASPAASNKFSRAAFDRACQTLGDRLGDIACIAMHSTVYLNLQDNDDIEFLQESKLDREIPYFKGRMVIVDDKMPVTAGTNSSKYTCYLFGKGSINYAQQSLPADEALAYEREELQGNGGGVDSMVMRRGLLMHPGGIKWTESSVAGAYPTNAELEAAANWDRVYDRKNIKIAALEVNAA